MYFKPLYNIPRYLELSQQILQQQQKYVYQDLNNTNSTSVMQNVILVIQLCQLFRDGGEVWEIKGSMPSVSICV